MKVLTMPNQRELSHQQAAEYLGLSPITLYQKNSAGVGPRHIRRFGKLHYTVEDLDAYKRANSEVREAHS